MTFYSVVISYFYIGLNLIITAILKPTIVLSQTSFWQNIDNIK